MAMNPYDQKLCNRGSITVDRQMLDEFKHELRAVNHGKTGRRMSILIK